MSPRTAPSRVASIIIGLWVGAFWFRACPAAVAASFSCGSGLSRVEKMICANATLSRLDDRLAAAFKKSVDVFGDGAGDDTDTGADLRRSQKAWIAARDACVTAECVDRLYRARVDVLEFRGRPGESGWADRVAGVFGYDNLMTLWVQVRDSNNVRVALSGAEPSSGRWVCDLTGFGIPTDGGGIDVRSGDGTNEALLTLRKTRSGFEAPDTQRNQATSSDSCGMGGTFILSYQRK